MYLKKIVLVLLLSFAFYYCMQKMTVQPLKTYTQAHFDTTRKPIVLWDIHHVILQKDYRALAHILWCCDTKKKIVRNSSWAMVKDMLVGLYDMCLGGSTAEVFATIARTYGNKDFADLVTQLANSQSLIPETALLIHDLHAQGYRQHIGSNIGATIFENLLTKPQVQTIFNANIFELNASQLVTYYPDGIHATIKKPQHAFYYAYLEKNNLTAQQVVFIDDKYENVLAAQQCGMYALQFKNASQLRADLRILLGLTL
ncbi:MAG: HAD-IA family hydrolase [Candidatus Dependentiae bacterium]|nr:HAD-IA family hydrolase [Candidatus Dependentiae bacterium]